VGKKIKELGMRREGLKEKHMGGAGGSKEDKSGREQTGKKAGKRRNSP